MVLEENSLPNNEIESKWDLKSVLDATTKEINKIEDKLDQSQKEFGKLTCPPKTDPI